MQEKRRRDKQDAESTVEPPLESAASMGGYIQSMQKFDMQNNDALVRGGDLDQEKEDIPDEILLDEKEVEKNVKKSQSDSTSTWLRKFLLKGQV